MKSKLSRTITSMILGISMLTVAATAANARIICEQVESCEPVCKINKKGVFTCTIVCEPVMECYDDGSGPGSGGVVYCYTEQLTGEVVCFMD